MTRYLAAVAILFLLAACGEESAGAGPVETRTATPEQQAEQPPTATIAQMMSIPTPILATPSLEMAVTLQAQLASTPTPIPATPTNPPQPELEEIYAQVGTALRERDMLYHATITHTVDAGLYSQTGSYEVWVDVARNVSRVELDTTMTESPEQAKFDVTQIITQNMVYSVYRSPEQRTDTTPSNTCYGTNEAVGVVLGCPGFTEESTTVIEQGVYDGQPAIVLVTTGSSSGSDERSTFTERFYLDRDTLLPIAKVTEGTLDYGTTVPLDGLETFQHEFVPRDSVPGDFFDPVVLAEEQLDAAPQPDFTVYWLGTTFDPGNGLPPMVLDVAGVPDHPNAPYDLMLSYRLADVRLNHYGGPAHEIVMQQWSSSDWHAEWDTIVRDHWERHGCYEQVDMEIAGGQATMFMGYGDPMAPPDRSFYCYVAGGV